MFRRAHAFTRTNPRLQGQVARLSYGPSQAGWAWPDGSLKNVGEIHLSVQGHPAGSFLAVEGSALARAIGDIETANGQDLATGDTIDVTCTGWSVGTSGREYPDSFEVRITPTCPVETYDEEAPF